MRSPWREPRRSAGRRARPASRCVAQAMASVARFRARGASPWQHALAPRGPNKTCASRRSASLFMCRKRVYFVRAGGQSSGTKCCENEVACVIARSASGEAIQGGQGGSGCSLDCGAALANFGRECAARTLIVCPPRDQKRSGAADHAPARWRGRWRRERAKGPCAKNYDSDSRRLLARTWFL